MPLAHPARGISFAPTPPPSPPITHHRPPTTSHPEKTRNQLIISVDREQDTDT